MASLQIRNMDPAVVDRFTELARRNQMSREEYLRQYLSRVLYQEAIDPVEEKYRNLVLAVSEKISEINYVLEHTVDALERVELLFDEQRKERSCDNWE